MADRKRRYKRDSTVEMNVGDNKKIKASELINFLEADYVSSVSACVIKNGDCYDVTVTSSDEARLLVSLDLELKGIHITSRLIYNEWVVVSIMHLPAYIEDEVIIKRIEAFGVETRGEVRDRMIKGTTVIDGTRMIEVKFPPHVKSLPYVIKFPTQDGMQHYSVKHDYQSKVCFKCAGDDHEIRNCPKTLCFKCKEPGHIARNCPLKQITNIRLCDGCGLYEETCECRSEEVNNTESAEVKSAWELNTHHSESRANELSIGEQETRATDWSLSVNKEEETEKYSKEEDTEKYRNEEESNDEAENEEELKGEDNTEQNSIHKLSQNQWSLVKRRTNQTTRLKFEVSEKVLKDNIIRNKRRAETQGENSKKQMLKKQLDNEEYNG
jgi:hypothetical protein